MRASRSQQISHADWHVSPSSNGRVNKKNAFAQKIAIGPQNHTVEAVFFSGILEKLSRTD
jgi:hypothetical protein